MPSSDLRCEAHTPSTTIHKRIALTVRYEGTAYCGWQLQAGDVPTVQARLESALSVIATQPIRVICAGRTDTGVHAQYQVVHFDPPLHRALEAWVWGANAHLPADIRVQTATEVSEDFHARFSALWRRYVYIIANTPVAPTLMRNTMTWIRKPLNVRAMKKAAACLVGEHDFSSFRGSRCQAKSPVRTVSQLSVTQVPLGARGEMVPSDNLSAKASVQTHGVDLGGAQVACPQFGVGGQGMPAIITIDITSNAFLHHMVRNIAGSLLRVGLGEAEVAWIAEVLAKRNRCAAGVRAPSHGLHMVDVEYPSVFGIPRMPLEQLMFPVS